eukprot:6367106-Amphidinium_carterae.1
MVSTDQVSVHQQLLRVKTTPYPVVQCSLWGVLIRLCTDQQIRAAKSEAKGCASQEDLFVREEQPQKRLPAIYHPTAIHYKINSPNPKTGNNYRN